MPPPDETSGATSKAEGPDARVTVKISLKPKIGKDDLKSKYKVEKYNLSEGYTMGPTLQSLVPKGTPEYVEHGENYVERVMRALYHFKQCALVGPSGAGKSICEGEPVFVTVDGTPTLTTVDSLFERLARRFPTVVDGDGWETMRLPKVDLAVLSYDSYTNRATWKRAHALARSRHKGEILEITTKRNRSIRATPGHSFVTDSKTTKAEMVVPGTRIPIVRSIPVPSSTALTSIAVLGYLPGARLTHAGAILAGGNETVQIPAPPVIALDEGFAWFLGFFVAEGSIGNGYASVSNRSQPLIWRCSTLLHRIGLVPWTRIDPRGLTELRVASKAFVAMLSTLSLSKRVGRCKGSQARYKKVPDIVFAMPEASRAAFLLGFFEGGGWEEKSEALFGTSSRDLANGLVILCQQLGIFPTVRFKAATKSYTICIAWDDAAGLGIDIAGVRRGDGLRGHVERVTVTPEVAALAREAYARLPEKMRSRRFHKRTVSSLCSRTKTIGLRQLRRVAQEIGSPELESMADSNVMWDSVKQVRRSDYDGWVYDFQVPGTETFAAGFGGVVTHNTHLTYVVAELAGLPLWEVNCGLQTSVYDLFGRFVGLGRENWVDGQIVSWCRYGGILYLDEANMMKQDVATRLNPLLDTRGHLVLNERDNEVIPRHPNGYVIISMNPYSAEFAGTKPLNAAFRRRMSVWVDFDYLSVGSKIAKDEVDMVARRAKVELPVAEKIIRVAAEVRRQYKAGDLPYAPSVGDLVNWATLVADGLSLAEAAEETIIALTSDDTEVQNNVRRIVRMVVGTGKEPSR